MLDTLQQLRQKSDHLFSRLRAHNIVIPKGDKTHLLAYIIGEKDWNSLCKNFKRNPKPYTSYHPSFDKLFFAINSIYKQQLSIEMAKLIIEEIPWPSYYVPYFNRFPLHDDSQILVPPIFMYSELFSLHRKREIGCRQKRIAITYSNSHVDKDRILYTGDSLNQYDRIIFLSLLHFHPSDCAVGREYHFCQRKLEDLCNKTYSPKSLLASLSRMKNCLIQVPDINFCGPLISTIRKVKSQFKDKLSLKISLNRQLTTFYYDPLYTRFMNSGNLYHIGRINDEKEKIFDYRNYCNYMDKLRQSDMSAYVIELESD